MARSSKPFVAVPRTPRPRRHLVRVAAAVVGALVVAALVVSACSREPERSVAEFCTHARPVIGFDVVIASGDTAKINRTLDDLRSLQQVSPSDIEPSVALIVSITDELSKALVTAKDPDLAAKEVFRTRQADVAKIDAAGQAIQTYANDNCHFSMVGTIPGGSVPGTLPASAGGSVPGTAKR